MLPTELKQLVEGSLTITKAAETAKKSFHEKSKHEKKPFGAAGKRFRIYR